MAKTRPAVARDDKQAEILDAAERRLLAGGYHAMSIASIARELGVAQNTIYWYFGSKDELLIAVIRRMLPKLASAKPAPEEGLVTQVLWFVDRMVEHQSLRHTVHERAQHSPAVAAFAEEFHELLAGMLSMALSSVIPASELPTATTSFLATVEGLLMRNLTPRERSKVLVYTLERLLHPR